jgi:C4-dicarboxylate-specific signal transduction histidine kinase
MEVPETGLTRMLVARPLGENPSCGRCHARDEAHRATLHLALAGSEHEIAQAMARRRLSAVATLVLLTTVVGLGVLVHVLLSRPLRGLRRGVEKVAAGDLSTRVPIPDSTELAGLATSFNAMTERVEETHRTQQSTIQAQLRELESSQAKLVHQEKLAGLGMMAAGVAHEVGNPLASISAAAQVASRRTDDPFIRKQVESILAQIDRISRIVRDLSDFSRPPSLAPVRSQVNELVETSIGLLRHDRRFRDVAVRLELDAALPPVRTIPDHVLEILFNLGLNAVEAMEESGSSGELEITTEREGGSIRIVYHDAGPGVPVEMRSRIFEPFFTTRAPGKGTGLGLSVSYGLAQSLGGDLVLDETSVTGARFVLTIPIEWPLPTDDESEEERAHARDPRIVARS